MFCVVRNRQRNIVSILYPKTYFVSLTLSLNSWQQDLRCRVHELGTIVQSLGFQRKQSQRRKMSHTPLTSGALARICQVFLTNLSSKPNSRKWCILHLRIVKCTEQFSGGGCPWASASSAWPKTNSRRGSGEVDWFCRNDISWIECMQWSQNNSYDHQWFPNLEAEDFRYRLLLNDGIYSNSFSMLATQVRFWASLLSLAIPAVPVCKFPAI